MLRSKVNTWLIDALFEVDVVEQHHVSNRIYTAFLWREPKPGQWASNLIAFSSFSSVFSWLRCDVTRTKWCEYWQTRPFAVQYYCLAHKRVALKHSECCVRNYRKQTFFAILTCACSSKTRGEIFATDAQREASEDKICKATNARRTRRHKPHETKGSDESLFAASINQ